MVELSISEKLDKLREKLDEQEEKKFKLPWSIKFSGGKLKKNFVVVEIIRANGGVEFKMVKIEDNTIKLDDIYYDASADYILRYGKYPMIILPEWNIKPIGESNEQKYELKPFSSRENLNEAVDKGTLTSAEKFILTKMKMDAIQPKSHISMKAVIIMLLVLAGGFVALKYFGVIK